MSASVRGSACGSSPTSLRGRPHLVDVAVAVPGFEPAAAAPVRRQERLDLGAVHPQQQLRVVDPVRAPGLGLDARLQAGVDGAQHGAGPLGLGRRPVGHGGDPLPRALQPAPGVVAEGGVGVEPGHDQRVHGLEQQRAEAGDGHRRVAVDPPADGAWSVQARVRRGRERRGDHGEIVPRGRHGRPACTGDGPEKRGEPVAPLRPAREWTAAQAARSSSGTLVPCRARIASSSARSAGVL